MFTADNANTLRTLRNIRKCIRNRLIDHHNVKIENLEIMVDEILQIHGIHKDHFDFLSRIDTIITGVLNDKSIDANSNKNEKTTEAVMQESLAPVRKAIGFDYLYRELRELYGKSQAQELMAEMFDFSLGLSDSTNILRPYCWALDASKIVTNGRDFGQLHSAPAQRVQSYISALCETVHQMSSHLAGAIAIGSFFLDIAHVLLFGKDTVDLRELKTTKYFRKALENEFQQFVHSVNHLSRNGVESPFSNVSIFDRVKLRTLIEDMSWYFPFDKLPIDHPDDLEEEDLKNFYYNYVVDYIIELQDIFIDFFDKGDPLKGNLPYRFPVITLNFGKKKWGDKWVIEDKRFLKKACRRDIYRYNLFASEGTKVASCCLEGDSSINVYDCEDNCLHITIKDFVELFIGGDGDVEQHIDTKFFIKDNEGNKQLINGVLRKRNHINKIIRIQIDKHQIGVTPDHLFRVRRVGSTIVEEKQAQELVGKELLYQIEVDD